LCVFNIDIETCEHCGGTAKIIASIEDSIVIKTILDHLRKNTDQTPATRIATGRTRTTPSDPSGPDGSGASPHPLGTDAESFVTPADTLSCRRQTNTENTPNIALSLTVPTLDPLTDRAISGGDPA
jgi:hypothetical protein